MGRVESAGRSLRRSRLARTAHRLGGSDGAASHECDLRLNSAVAVGHDERIPAGVLVDPAQGLDIEYDVEFVHPEIMQLAISKPLNLDPGRSGIVDNRRRLEAGA